MSQNCTCIASIHADVFVRGTTAPGKGLAELIQEAEMRGATGAEVDKVEKEWLEEHPLCTFNEGGILTHLIQCAKLIHSQPWRMLLNIPPPSQQQLRTRHSSIISKQLTEDRTLKPAISRRTSWASGYAGIGIVRHDTLRNTLL